MYNFDGTHGVEPLVGLLQGTGGNFYGTSYLGGTHNLGTIFEVTPAGVLTTMHSFDNTDGDNPSPDWFKPPMEISTGQPREEGPTTQAQYSKSPHKAS